MSDLGTRSIARNFDVARALDQAKVGRTHKLVLVLIAAAIALDGFDNQVLGFAIPLLLREWNVTRAAVAPVLALGFCGMALGTIGGGALGDRIGRKPSLILSVLIFSIATGLTAFAKSVEELAIYRTIAGFGLGGAMPAAATLLAEFAPAHRRSMAVTLGIVCIPLGGVLGGVIASVVLPAFGWRVLFMIGGVMPLLVVLLQVIFLPESPRFLVRHPARHLQLAALMAQLGHDVTGDTAFSDSQNQARVGAAPFSALVSKSYRRDTLGLWVAFFTCLLATYLIFSWTPQLLTQAGFGLAIASVAVAVFNVGGVAGAIAAAALIPRLGSRAVMLFVAAGGVAGALVLAALPAGLTSASVLLIAMAIEGGFINAVQTSLYALAAQMYPVGLRATGVGASAGVGRTGAIISSFVGAYVLGAGWSSYFIVIALSLLVAAAVLAIMRLHIAPAVSETRI